MARYQRKTTRRTSSHRERLWEATILVLFSVLAPHAAWASDYFVSPSGDDSNPGTEDQPLATITKGLELVDNGDRLIIREGVYRLTDEADGAVNFHRPDATADNHVVIQAYEGEHVVILGSRSSEGQTWENAGNGLYRMPADFLAHDPTGMFRLGSDIEDATRIEHVMVMRGGVRSHADATALEDPGTWTKADDSGVGCDKDNAGCYIYLRPAEGNDPSNFVYEFSQRKLAHFQGTSYLEIRGLTFYYTQNEAFGIEGGEGQLVENNVFGHNSNGNDNAYSIFISYGAAPIVRNNEAFDSRYWGGFSNSKGLTFMDIDPNRPPLVEGNYVHDIMGQGICTKDGVANLVARRNILERVGVGIQASGPRCHWTAPDCVEGDPEYYPGGGWQIYENLFIGCGHGVNIIVWSETQEAGKDNHIFNNVFLANETSGVDQRLANAGTLVANNIFMNNPRAMYLDHGNGDETKTVEDFLPTFTSHHNLFFQNDADYLLRPNWGGPSGSGTAYSLDEMQQNYGIEEGSLSGDPLFVSETDRDFHLQDGSPAKGSGDGSFYDRDSVDMGMYPFGDDNGQLPTDGGIQQDDGGTAQDSGGQEQDAGGNANSGSNSGCGCQTGGPAHAPFAAFPTALLLLGLLLRKRR